MKTPIPLTTITLLSSTSLALSTTPQFQCSPSPALPPLTVDIAILGGGASGTYSALHLHNNQPNQTFALIEARPKLGGQVNTYHDPSTGLTVEYGVNQYTDVPGAAEFLEALGIPYTRSGTGGGNGGGGSGYIDIQNGRILDDPSEEEGNETARAIQVYRELLAQYPELEEGFLFPEPVPEDLVLSFTDFARKYGIERAVLPLSTGMGDLSSVPTLYVMKHYGAHVYRNRFLYTARKNNQEIYNKAQQFLGDSVFLSSKPLAIQRDNDSVQICLQTPTGTQLLRAKRFLITIPPTLDTLKGTSLDLTPEETALFTNFSRIGYYSTLIRIPGFLPFSSFQQNQQDNTDNITLLENTSPANTFNLPELPAIWNIHKTHIPDLYQIEYGAATPLSEDTVKQNIFTDLSRLRNTGLIITTATDTATDSGVQEDPVIVRFADHSPFYPYASPEAIKDGFYKRLAELQGERGTWWTGGAFHVPDSSLLWRFSEGVVEGLVKSIEEGG